MIYYTILWCIILYYTVLYYAILYYIILYHTLPCYSILYCIVILPGIILYYTVLYYSILYYVILYCIISIYIYKCIYICIELYHTILYPSRPRRATGPARRPPGPEVQGGVSGGHDPQRESEGQRPPGSILV